jgi:hypothetical protein
MLNGNSAVLLDGYSKSTEYPGTCPVNPLGRTGNWFTIELVELWTGTSNGFIVSDGKLVSDPNWNGIDNALAVAESVNSANIMTTTLNPLIRYPLNILLYYIYYIFIRW